MPFERVRPFDSEQMATIDKLPIIIFCKMEKLSSHLDDIVVRILIIFPKFPSIYCLEFLDRFTILGLEDVNGNVISLLHLFHQFIGFWKMV
jgi:hypothetical protein